LTWVDEQIYAGGGAHIPSTWGPFSDQTGITAVLHLSPDHPERFLGPPPRAFLWLDLEGEPQASLDARLLAAKFVRTCLQDGRRILLHSALGRHRTRWVFVAYRLFMGTSLSATLRMAASKPWLGPYETDEAEWQAFLESLQGESRFG
jgi:hypothetical protein